MLIVKPYFRLIVTAIIATLLNLSPTQFSAQVVTTNQQGEKIIKFDDGSWRYYDASDSIKAIDVGNQETFTNKINIHRYLEDLYANIENEISNLEERKKVSSEKAALAKEQLENFKKDKDIDKTAFQIAVNEFSATKEQLQSIKKDLKKAKSLYIYLSVLKGQDEISLEENLKSRNLDMSFYDGTNADLIIKDYLYISNSGRTKSTKVSNTSSAPINKETSELQKISPTDSVDSKIQDTNPEITVNVEKPTTDDSDNMDDDIIIEQELTSDPTPETIIINQTIDTKETSLFIQQRKEMKSLSEIKIEQPCPILRQGKLKFTDIYITEVGPIELISYTPEKIKSFHLNQELVTGLASISRSKGLISLNLEFIIASDKAVKSFGGIIKNNLLQISFISGKDLKLFATTTDTGRVDKRTGYTIYRSKFYLDNKAQKILSDDLIDNITVVWKSGYETYPIYNVDGLNRLLNCLSEI